MPARRYINTVGTVIAITDPASGATPVVRVNLDVNNRLLALVFQSRSTLASLDIGDRVRVRGAVVDAAGMPTIYNPDYAIERAV